MYRHVHMEKEIVNNISMISEVKILFENIKNFRHLITEGVGENSIVDAINNHEWVYLYYTGDEKTASGYRTVRPYVIGTQKNSGNKVLRAWQDNPKNSWHFDNKPTRRDSEKHDYWVDEEGSKPGWRLFRIDKITKILPIGKKFVDSNGAVMIPAGYHEGGDADMSSIDAYVSTKNQPNFEYRYDKEFYGKESPNRDVIRQKWDGIRRGNAARTKITSSDVIKLRDLASKFHKKSMDTYVVVVDDKNNYQLVTANDIKRERIPDSAVVGSLPYLYDSIVKKNAPENDKFFNDTKNKTQANINQKKGKEMESGFQSIQEIDKNSPSIPFERKTFFKK